MNVTSQFIIFNLIHNPGIIKFFDCKSEPWYSLITVLIKHIGTDLCVKPIKDQICNEYNP